MGRRRRYAHGDRKGRPSRFASAKLADGRSLGWEGLQIEPCYVPISEAMSLAFTTGTQSVFFQQLVPNSETRGVITLSRTFIQFSCLFNTALLIDPGLAAMCIHANLQLVPVEGGAFEAAAVINPRNIAMLNSARILWRRSFWPAFLDGATGAGFLSGFDTQTQFDVKTSRRWDRDEYSMVLAVVTETVGASENHIAYDVRGLFRSGDGV